MDTNFERSIVELELHLVLIPYMLPKTLNDQKLITML